MEYFTFQTYKEQLNKNLKPISLIIPFVTHLLYAYDLLIFLKVDVQNAEIINEIFVNLKEFTGLQINDNKSKICFSKSCSNM